MVILTLLAIRLARAVTASRIEEPARRQQAWTTIRNVALASCGVLLALVWGMGLEKSTLPLAAVAGATLLVSKELLLSAIGGCLLFLTQSYRIGDFIEIHGIRGRVADIRFLSTILDECGEADLITGRRVVLQHASLVTGSIHVLSGDQYTLSTLRVSVQSQEQALAREAALLEAAQVVCADWLQEADAQIAGREAQQWNRLPSARPKTFLDLTSDKGVQIVVAFPCRAEDRLRIEQQVLSHYLRSLSADPRALTPEGLPGVL